MANYHSLSDYPDQPAGRGGFGGGGGPAPQLDEEGQRAAGMFATFSGGDMSKNPRTYNFWDFWKYTFCPEFSVKKLPFVLWFIITVIYLVSLGMCFMPQFGLDSTVFLGPDVELLYKLQILSPYNVQQNYQLWRLITPLFITQGFTQYINSTFFLLIFGYMFQGTGMSTWKQVIFYFSTGLVGYLFAMTCDMDSQMLCGPMPAISGLIGGMLGALIKNINALEGLGGMRFCLIALLVLAFLATLLYTMPLFQSVSNQLKAGDPLGELGGWLAGLFLGMAIMPAVRAEAQRPKSFEKRIQLVGFALFAVMNIILWPCMFLACDYTKNTVDGQ